MFTYLHFSFFFSKCKPFLHTAVDVILQRWWLVLNTHDLTSLRVRNSRNTLEKGIETITNNYPSDADTSLR